MKDLTSFHRTASGTSNESNDTFSPALPPRKNENDTFCPNLPPENLMAGFLSCDGCGREGVAPHSPETWRSAPSGATDLAELWVGKDQVRQHPPSLSDGAAFSMEGVHKTASHRTRRNYP